MTEINTLDKLSAKATEGEWFTSDAWPCANHNRFYESDGTSLGECWDGGYDDCAFIVAAVNTIRRLLADPEGRAAIERVNGL